MAGFGEGCHGEPLGRHNAESQDFCDKLCEANGCIALSRCVVATSLGHAWLRLPRRRQDAIMSSTATAAQLLSVSEGGSGRSLNQAP